MGQEADRYNCDCGGEAEDLGILSSVPEESENEDSNCNEDQSASGQSSDKIEKGEQSTNSQSYDDQLHDMTKQFEDLTPTIVSPMQNNVSTYFPSFHSLSLLSSI